MNKVGFDINRALYSAFLVRCHEEGLNPDEVLSKWMERALRQERTVIPMTGSDGESKPAEVDGDSPEDARVLRLSKQKRSA